MSHPDPKRILFVDDDPALLAGLRTRLHHMSHKWNMTFAESGARAIEEFERQPFDVIVSDARMPRMDGTQLLNAVSERWPEAIRIVLSGHADQALGLQFVTVAHQYLRKPCQAQQFDSVIDRCLRVQDLLPSPTLRAMVGRVRQLPVIPQAFGKLQSVLAQENVPMSDIAQIVGSDTVVTARVLQMANSAFYRRPRRITNLEQAVNQMGLASLRNLVLSAEVFTRWPQQPPDVVLNLEGLQHQAQMVAQAARTQTAPSTLADDTVLAALLHKIGYWVLLQECPAELERALELARAERIPMQTAETQVIGASHAQIGAYLLGIWGLPQSIITAVAHHLAPEDAEDLESNVLEALIAARSGVDESKAFRPPQ